MPDYRKLSKEWKYVRIPKDTLSFCPGDGPPIFVLKNNVMGKLQPDYITWTLSVNADGLQKEMLKVRNNTKELKAENVRRNPPWKILPCRENSRARSIRN